MKPISIHHLSAPELVASFVSKAINFARLTFWKIFPLPKRIAIDTFKFTGLLCHKTPNVSNLLIEGRENDNRKKQFYRKQLPNFVSCEEFCLNPPPELRRDICRSCIRKYCFSSNLARMLPYNAAHKLCWSFCFLYLFKSYE